MEWNEYINRPEPGDATPRETKLVPLVPGKHAPGGGYARVDVEDYDSVMQEKWRVMRYGRTCYAFRCRRSRGETPLSLHRFVMQSPAGLEVDHIDGDGLNCSKSNLRLADRVSNARNRKVHKNNTSGYKGVSWHRASGAWAATIKVSYKRIWLGLHPTKEDAARAYDIAARQHYGDFARLNFQGGE